MNLELNIQPGVPVNLPIQIRPAEDQDYAFILASWSNDAHKIKYDSFIPNSIFFPRQKAFINKVLSNSIIHVAHVEDDRDLICGYLVVEPKFQMNTLLIHWAHTKPIYRRQGVYKALLNNYIGLEDPITVVTSPFTLLPEFKKKYNVIYDPSHVDHLRAQ